MKKITIIGVSGNGKTTLSKKLSAKFGIPHIELDALYHQPGWIGASDEVFRKSVEDAMNKSDGWIIDGGYSGKLGDLVLDQTETLVWLDLPLTLTLYRLLKRCTRDMITNRDLYNGNRQTIRNAFFVKDSLFSYAIKIYFKKRKEWPKMFARFPKLEVVHLRSPKEVKRWVESVSS